MEDLKAIVGADISQLKKGMADAQKELAKTAVAAGKLDSTLGRAAKGSNSATFALTNLGRVAQDLPFGFIGIANNLNPLLESFQRLQKEAGGTRGALKALMGSLGGAGGLGLALSVITTVVSFVTMGFQAWTRGMGDSEKKVKDNEKAVELSVGTYERFLGVVDQISKTLAEESTKVGLLFNALSDANTGLKDRKEIIDQLIKISPAYFDGLSVEKSSYEQISKAVNDYNEGIARTTQIKALLPQFEGMIQKVIRLQVELNEMKRFQGGAFALPEEEFQKEAKVITDQIRGITNEIKVAKQALSQMAGGALQLQEILFGKPDKADKTAKNVKDIETLTDVLRKMEAQLVVFRKEEDAFGINKSLDKIKLFESTITEIFTKFKVAAKDPVIIGLQFRAADIKLTEFSKSILKANPDLKQGIPFEFNAIPVFNKGGGQTLLDNILREQILDSLKNLNIKYDIWGNILTPFTSLDTLKKTFDPVKKELADLTFLMQDSFANIAAGIGESLGKAFTEGGSFLRNALGGVFGIMGDFLVQLGKAAVLTSKLFLAIKASKLNPIVGIIGGIAAIAAGTILKNIKLPQFQHGGSVTGPGSRTSDSILARLSTGEYVMSAATVSKFGKTFFDMLNSGFMPPKMATGGSVGGGSIGGGQFIEFRGDFEIRGDKLVAVVQRAQNRLNRNG